MPVRHIKRQASQASTEDGQQSVGERGRAGRKKPHPSPGSQPRPLRSHDAFPSPSGDHDEVATIPSRPLHGPLQSTVPELCQGHNKGSAPRTTVGATGGHDVRLHRRPQSHLVARQPQSAAPEEYRDHANTQEVRFGWDDPFSRENDDRVMTARSTQALPGPESSVKETGRNSPPPWPDFAGDLATVSSVGNKTQTKNRAPVGDRDDASLNPPQPYTLSVTEEALVSGDDGFDAHLLCGICSCVDINAQVPNCGQFHVFCHDCLAAWFERQQSCPLCQASVDPSYTRYLPLVERTSLLNALVTCIYCGAEDSSAAPVMCLKDLPRHLEGQCACPRSKCDFFQVGCAHEVHPGLMGKHIYEYQRHHVSLMRQRLEELDLDHDRLIKELQAIRRQRRLTDDFGALGPGSLEDQICRNSAAAAHVDSPDSRRASASAASSAGDTVHHNNSIFQFGPNDRRADQGRQHDREPISFPGNSRGSVAVDKVSTAAVEVSQMPLITQLLRMTAPTAAGGPGEAIMTTESPAIPSPLGGSPEFPISYSTAATSFIAGHTRLPVLEGVTELGKRWSAMSGPIWSITDHAKTMIIGYPRIKLAAQGNPDRGEPRDRDKRALRCLPRVWSASAIGSTKRKGTSPLDDGTRCCLVMGVREGPGIWIVNRTLNGTGNGPKFMPAPPLRNGMIILSRWAELVRYRKSKLHALITFPDPVRSPGNRFVACLSLPDADISSSMQWETVDLDPPTVPLQKSQSPRHVARSLTGSPIFATVFEGDIFVVIDETRGESISTSPSLPSASELITQMSGLIPLSNESAREVGVQENRSTCGGLVPCLPTLAKREKKNRQKDLTHRSTGEVTLLSGASSSTGDNHRGSPRSPLDLIVERVVAEATCTADQQLRLLISLATELEIDRCRFSMDPPHTPMKAYRVVKVDLHGLMYGKPTPDHLPAHGFGGVPVDFLHSDSSLFLIEHVALDKFQPSVGAATVVLQGLKFLRFNVHTKTFDSVQSFSECSRLLEKYHEAFEPLITQTIADPQPSILRQYLQRNTQQLLGSSSPNQVVRVLNKQLLKVASSEISTMRLIERLVMMRH